MAQFSNPELSWDELEFLRAETELPILLKGILHPDDARMAREHGIDGVVVSNHGGRQIDGEIAALDALPAVVDAVGDELAVVLDSGVRSGADVAKALALGADAVAIGRPYLWGLALGGEAGRARGAARRAGRARPDDRAQRPPEARRARAGVARARGRRAGLRAGRALLALAGAALIAGCGSDQQPQTITVVTTTTTTTPTPTTGAEAAKGAEREVSPSTPPAEVDAAPSAAPPAPEPAFNLDPPPGVYPAIWVRANHEVEVATEPGGGELVTRIGRRDRVRLAERLRRRRAARATGPG